MKRMSSLCQYCKKPSQLDESVRILREFSTACRTTDLEAFDNEMMRLCEEVRVFLEEDCNE